MHKKDIPPEANQGDVRNAKILTGLSLAMVGFLGFQSIMARNIAVGGITWWFFLSCLAATLFIIYKVVVKYRLTNTVSLMVTCRQGIEGLAQLFKNRK